MAIVITKQPSNKTFVVGKISGTLSVEATGAESFQWMQAQDSDSTDSAVEVVGQTTATLTIPTDLTEGSYYFFCAISGDVDDDDGDGDVVGQTTATVEVINSEIATVQVFEFLEYITGEFVHTYIEACAENIQERFEELQVLRGIEIPNNNDVLLTAQVELFMEAL